MEKKMDGYGILISSLQNILEQNNPKYDKENIKIQISSLQSVAGKSKEEICALYDTGAFNDITRGYICAAMKNCNIAEKKQNEILDELNWLHDIMGAKSVTKEMDNESLEIDDSEETAEDRGE